MKEIKKFRFFCFAARLTPASDIFEIPDIPPTILVPMSSLKFLISEWGSETIQLEIYVVDTSPDGIDENVFCAKIHDEEVYFEAHVDAKIHEILDEAVKAVKDFIDYESF